MSDEVLERGMHISLDDGHRRIEVDGQSLPLHTSKDPVKVDYIEHTGPGEPGDGTAAWVTVKFFVNKGLIIDPEALEAGVVEITTPAKAFNWVEPGV